MWPRPFLGLCLPLSITCIFALALLTSPVGRAAALSADVLPPCVQQHTVRQGQTLIAIAQQYGTTVAHLIAINPGVIYNPNQIRSGVSLCIRLAEQGANATVEVHYEYTPPAEENAVQIAAAKGGLLGQRKRFPLVADGIKLFKTRSELVSALQAAPVTPILWGSNNAPDEPGNYTLFLLRPAQPWFTTLALREGCRTPVQEALSSATLKVNTATVTFAIETTDGVRYPFPVTHLSQVTTFGQTDPCTSSLIDFALLPLPGTNSQYYQLFVLRPEARLAEVEESTDEVQPIDNRVALEINYQNWGLVGKDELGLLTPGVLVGRRVEYPLAPFGGFQPVTDGATLPENALAGNPAPLFYGFRQGEQNEYTLVALGDATLFSTLLLTTSQIITVPIACQWTTVQEAIVSPQLTVNDLTLFFEDEQGARYPLQVTRLGLVPTGQKANECRDPSTVIAFALYRSAESKYQFKILFNDASSEVGPPGARRSANCRRWRLARGFVYGLLRSWWGCW